MNAITITGTVVGGCREFRKKICLPEDLLSGHEDWMPSFVQGTLNVLFPISELPQFLQSAGLRALDLNESFPPAIYRNGADVPDNTIRPNACNPRRGDLQLWKAILCDHRAQKRHQCFLIRRVDSGYKDKAEILGQQNFRDDCQFVDGHQVSIDIFAGADET